MYNLKDIQFVGKHDYDKENAMTESGWNKTFSVGIFNVLHIGAVGDLEHEAWEN